MRSPRTARRWIWAALAVQAAGLAFDGVWHGLVHPGFEPATRREMLVHLLTVHLPLYVGVVSVLVTTAWAFAEQARRSRVGWAWRVAAAGALLSTVGEAWHASIHLRLSPHGGPVAESVAALGFVIVAPAVWRAGREEDRGDAGARRAH